MNNLTERYIGAVCSYFTILKKKKVQKDLEETLEREASHYENEEDMLLDFGHPKSVALGYGYRPFTPFSFHPKIISRVEKYIYGISGIYLFLSTFYYLYQFKVLPFQSTNTVVSSLSSSNFFTMILSKPIPVMLLIALFSLLALFILNNNSDESYKNIQWDLETLQSLPHPSHYPNHLAETVLMIIFGLFFFLFTLFFSREVILFIQHSSYQMIHLMIYFFQPFIMIILFDYFIDMTKKIYTRRYIVYTTIINLFILLSLSIFIIKSDFLKDYLLPSQISIEYSMVNFFIIGALVLIYLISFYKLVRNLRSYLLLFKK